MAQKNEKKEYKTFSEYKDEYFPKKRVIETIEDKENAYNIGKKLATQSFNRFKHILNQ